MNKTVIPEKKMDWWAYSLVNPAERLLALKKIKGILKHKKGLIKEFKEIRKEWDRPLPKF